MLKLTQIKPSSIKEYHSVWDRGTLKMNHKNQDWCFQCVLFRLNRRYTFTSLYKLLWRERGRDSGSPKERGSEVLKEV